MKREDLLLQELKSVLKQYDRMQEGFAKARDGLRQAVKNGRVSTEVAAHTEYRLSSGRRAYGRAGVRLAGAVGRVWGDNSRTGR